MLFQYHMFESMQYMLNGIKTTAAKKKKTIYNEIFKAALTLTSC